MKFFPLFFLLLMGLGLGSLPAAEPGVESTNVVPPAPVFGTGVVARVNRVEVPYSWFLHEFRSTFFQYADADEARRSVMDELVDRALLYDRALQSGVTNDPVVQAKLDRQFQDIEAFMRYQMEMARMGLIIEAHLEQHPPAALEALSEAEVEAFYAGEMAGQPGAPEHFRDVPKALQGQIRRQADQVRRQEILDELVGRLRTNAQIQVNTPLLKATPLPDMKGDVPDAFRAP